MSVCSSPSPTCWSRSAGQLRREVGGQNAPRSSRAGCWRWRRSPGSPRPAPGSTINRWSRCTCTSPGPGSCRSTAEDRVIASVTRLGNLTARKLVVLVNPTTQEYQIDWERSALVNGLVPAQFTMAEDNKTYDLSGQAGPLMEILQILKANNVPFNGWSTFGRTRCAPADPGGGAPGGRSSRRRAAQPARSPRPADSRSPSGSRSWRHCAPAVR